MWRRFSWPRGSLRRALIGRLVLALTVIGLIGAALASIIVNRYANLAYDRAMADDIAILASDLHLDGSDVHVNLPPVAREWMLSNEGERVLYRVVDLRTGATLDSNGDLGAIERDELRPELTQFRYARLGSTEFRVGSLLHLLPGSQVSVLVEIAETLGQRHRIVAEILLSSLGIFGLMIAAAVTLVWTGTQRALQPLELLEKQAAQRSSVDLAPLDPSLAPVEVRALVVAINHLIDRLSQSMQSQSRFIANAAHQLRTPLAGLRLQAQLGIDEAAGSPLRERLAEIDRSASRAGHLVEQLLTLARAESGGTALRGERVDLVAAARDVVERHLAFARTRDIDLGYQGSVASAAIDGNGVLVREMFSNLVDNALRYGHAGDSVTIAVRESHDEIVVGVSDDGEGLPEAIACDLFARFNRVDSAAGSGAGLGLAIVKEIAELHGAHVSHRRLEPHGTEIVVGFRADSRVPDDDSAPQGIAMR